VTHARYRIVLQLDRADALEDQAQAFRKARKFDEALEPAKASLDIRERLLPMLRLRAECFRDRLVPELARRHIHLRHWEALSDAQRREAAEYFDAQISAALTPLVILPTQPFPFFSNLSISLAFALHDDRTGESVDARVKVPAELPQWVPLAADVPPGHRVFVRLHEVIRENAHKLYPGMRLTAAGRQFVERYRRFRAGLDSAMRRQFERNFQGRGAPRRRRKETV